MTAFVPSIFLRYSIPILMFTGYLYSSCIYADVTHLWKGFLEYSKNQWVSFSHPNRQKPNFWKTPPPVWYFLCGKACEGPFTTFCLYLAKPSWVFWHAGFIPIYHVSRFRHYNRLAVDVQPVRPAKYNCWREFYRVFCLCLGVLEQEELRKRLAVCVIQIAGGWAQS